ncbi:hypothetical protein DPMN_108123 [Dreissena polymorpha]|uniref:Uncharacterized protein n=1 Tax=Dreissena polymorpha TaxID=45954 RepID=A0A9D4K810_DREPO|nr:hypothetical protein DPMN_108123 [Dreissena polymorpha]
MSLLVLLCTGTHLYGGYHEPGFFNYVQSACARRDPQQGEQKESRWVHVVKKVPIPEVVSVSSVNKLTQVVEKLLDAVE